MPDSPQAPNTTKGLHVDKLTVLGLSIPVAVGYVPLGMVYGFLAVQAGLPVWLTVAASLLVYAGASQFMMISMLGAGLPIGAIAMATFVINLRHMFYGLSLLGRMPSKPLARWYAIFGLTDETFSVLTTLPASHSAQQVVALTLLNQIWWLTGSLLGALIGEHAQLQIVGLDFALAALFAVLALEQWRAGSTSAPLVVALGAYLLAYWWMPEQALALAIAGCVLAGLLWPLQSTAAAKAKND